MDDLKSLQALAEIYDPKTEADLFELAGQYQGRNEQELLDIAAFAADVSVDSITELGLEPEADPLFIEAFRRQYPNVDLEELVGRSPESIQGFVNG